MSYTVLARRYRSANFDDLVGQKHIAQTLKRAIESNRIAHAYLFCGTRGTGKTSTARILAKALNCEKSKGPTPDPCGVCSSCQGIARGDDIDVLEIDAASNTQVDKTREVILDNSAYRPARSRFKIYIIDEVHMLSKASFNALLKTLEEPPEHVKFILATTEPEKVLPTILSRCQRYDFRNIPTREIADHLREICKKEKIEADDDALLMVAKAGAGSMRDSLSLLDRLFSIGEKRVTVELIEQLLGLPKSQLIYDLAQVIGEGNSAAALNQSDAIITGGLSPESLLAALIDHLRNILILRTCGPESKLVEVPGLSIKQLTTQAELFDAVILTQDIAILEELRRLLRTSQAGRALLDATLVRLALAEQFRSITDLVGQVNGRAPSAAPTPAQKKKPELTDRTEDSGLRTGVGSSRAEHPVVNPQSSPDTRSSVLSPQSSHSTQSSVLSPQSSDDDDDDLPAVGKVWESSGPSVFELLKKQSSPKPAASPEPANIEPVSLSDLPTTWKNFLNHLSSEKQLGLYGILSQGRLVAIEDGQAMVKIPEAQAKMVEKRRDQVRDLFNKFQGRNIGIKFEVDNNAPPPPAPNRPAPAPSTAKKTDAPTPPPMPMPTGPAPLKLTPELLDKVTADPLVGGIIEQLGGAVVRVTEEG